MFSKKLLKANKTFKIVVILSNINFDILRKESMGFIDSDKSYKFNNHSPKFQNYFCVKLRILKG